MATDHYIPQSLLRRFADHEHGGSLNVLDKMTGGLFFPRVKDFGIEDFHTYSSKLRNDRESDEVPKLESLLNERFEDPANLLLKEVVDGSTLAGLSPTERQLIIEFIALQYVRTPGRTFDLRAAVARISGDQEPARTLKVFGTPNKPHELRDVSLLELPFDAVGLADVLRRAHLALISAPGDMAVVGDNPAIARSYLEFPENLHAGYPISAPGSDAFLPISPRHILYLHTDVDAVTGSCGKTLTTPLHISIDAMNYLNGLQGKAAVRFVVLPRQDQEAQVKTDIVTQTSVNFEFWRAFR